MTRYLIAVFSFILCIAPAAARNIVWYNPLGILGKTVFNQPLNSGDYTRLPAEAEKKVRKDVWSLSRHSAGLTLKFRSNSPEIKIRYTVAGKLAMEHMPATGVSGLDLYARTDRGETMWCAAERRFADTILYNYHSLKYNPDSPAGHTYELYLPLYNSVKWMEIGIADDAFLEFMTDDGGGGERPVVVYGTSIAQGACASRPGMAWTAILHRAIERDIVNLGFSGNGRLEPAVLNYISDIDASLYILDCMPNMSERFPPDTTYNRLIAAVALIRGKHPLAPILLTEHAGYTNSRIRAGLHEAYSAANKASRKAFDTLKKDDRNIYYLTCEEIAMPEEGMVDGIHPSDYGMEAVARAYEKKIKSEIDDIP